MPGTRGSSGTGEAFGWGLGVGRGKIANLPDQWRESASQGRARHRVRTGR